MQGNVMDSDSKLLPITKKARLFQAHGESVIPRPFLPGTEERLGKIVRRVCDLDDDRIKEELAKIESLFQNRHRDATAIFRSSFAELVRRVPDAESVDGARRALLGATFSMEYALCAAALFNPSIVAHPDQTGISDNELRCILSLRATGEGHISSVMFAEGVISTDGSITVEEQSPHLETGSVTEIGGNSYETTFDQDLPVSGRVLFPQSADESAGIEDARLVQFVDADGDARYYGLFTGYDGARIAPRIFSTDDFRSFRFDALSGSAVGNKDFSLFPQRIKGQYAMISRQDGENIYIMYSDNLLRWEEATLLCEPKHIWESIQIGSCGSPLLIPEGWLLPIHGVGPFRRYTIGMVLLDRENPNRVIARSKHPLLEPDATERNGYVPNVVYSCGALVHGDLLVLPYAASDSWSSVVTFDLAEVLRSLA